mmetsp:Transcript_61563/g.133255  ORF Transcript_61563/g.133255 Transcript_61563/m.133255 type:complete len:289 (+) Transcript_61563:51-917(+)
MAAAQAGVYQSGDAVATRPLPASRVSRGPASVDRVGLSYSDVRSYTLPANSRSLPSTYPASSAPAWRGDAYTYPAAAVNASWGEPSRSAQYLPRNFPARSYPEPYREKQYPPVSMIRAEDPRSYMEQPPMENRRMEQDDSDFFDVAYGYLVQPVEKVLGYSATEEQEEQQAIFYPRDPVRIDPGSVDARSVDPSYGVMDADGPLESNFFSREWPPVSYQEAYQEAYVEVPQWPPTAHPSFRSVSVSAIAEAPQYRQAMEDSDRAGRPQTAEVLYTYEVPDLWPVGVCV